MSSGQVMAVFDTPGPATSFAPLSIRPGGSTPAEWIPCWLFDGGSTIEYKDFQIHLLNYGGGGLTVTLPWAAASATSGNVRWGVAFHWLVDDTDDIDSSHSYDYNDVDDACASASGEVVYTTITFSDGSDMDSGANGQWGVMRVRREASHANDTMNSTDAQLLMPVVKET